MSNIGLNIIMLVIGIAIGLAVAFFLKAFRQKSARELASDLIDGSMNTLKAEFGNLSLEALSKSTEVFLKLAKESLGSERLEGAKDLESKKELIDKQLEVMTAELKGVTELVKTLEKDREGKFSELANELKNTKEQTAVLLETTASLNKTLSNTQARGQWGERMAEDVLRVAGFIENVNYLKQKKIEDVGTKPDYTFLLPKDMKLNMDVKFPMENYVKFIETDIEVEKETYRKQFLSDVKSRIKEVTTRDYINPEQNTVDYVLLFIPNEQIYVFIQTQDQSILEDSLSRKVILCSPITMFAILAVIRKAVDNFALERTSKEIISLLGKFHKNWEKFVEKMADVGKGIQNAQEAYEDLVGVRKRQLERPLNKIEELREQRALSSIEDEEETVEQ